MTYEEMIAYSADDAVFGYSENGVNMGVGTRAEIDRTIAELSIDASTMRFQPLA